MKPIIRWTLWERKWSTIWWSVGTSAYVLLNIVVYSSVKGQTAALNQALKQIPKTVMSLFTSTNSLISPVGYLDSKVYYLIMPLLLGILAIGLGSSLISREEQNGTIEHLLARPLSRGKLMVAKLTAGLIVLSTVSVITLVTTAVSSRFNSLNIATVRLLEATVLSLILASLFGAIAFFISSLGKAGRGASVGIASFIALGSYLATSLENQAQWLRWPAKILPYHYYQSAAVLQGTYNWWNAVVLLAATAVLLGLSFVAFRRRDIG